MCSHSDGGNNGINRINNDTDPSQSSIEIGNIEAVGKLKSLEARDVEILPTASDKEENDQIAKSSQTEFWQANCRMKVQVEITEELLQPGNAQSSPKLMSFCGQLGSTFTGNIAFVHQTKVLMITC